MNEMLEQEQEDAQLTQATHYECNEVRQGYIMSETSSLITIAVNEDGYREVPGAAEGMKEDKASWVSLILSRLVDTFFSRISLTMPPSPKSHNTVCV